MKSEVFRRAGRTTHFLLDPPAAFEPTANGVMRFSKGENDERGVGHYTGLPFHRIFWSKPVSAAHPIVVTAENDDFIEVLRAIVEAGNDTVPLAYLLVQQRCLTPGNVLDLLAHSSFVPPCAVTKYALDIMLASWTCNLRDDYTEPLPLVSARPLDVGGAGTEAYIDSDPVTETLVEKLIWSAENPRGTPLAMFKLNLARKALFPGEPPASILARLDIWLSSWHHYAKFTRGTLRQVFAGVLDGKTVLGRLPPDYVRPGPHTDDNWAS